jgi:hypothetical protein
MNTITLFLASVVATPAEMTKTFDYDFTRVGDLPPSLEVFGPDAADFLKAEPGGLRISLAAKRTRIAGVGVRPRCPVTGDFEISLSFDALTVEVPTKGYGSGVNLHLILDNPREEALTLLRGRRAKEGDIYLTNRARKGDDGKMQFRLKTFPGKATAGRLCIRRVGATIHYLIADAPASELWEIDQSEVGTEDVRAIRLAANTGGSPSALDVRLLDVHVASGPVGGSPSDWSRPRALWLVLGGGGVCLLSAVGVLLYRRRKAPASTPPAKKVVAEQAVGGSRPS